MPLQIPTSEGVKNALETYIRAEAPELDPTPERRSKIGAWVRSLAFSIFDWYVTLKDYADNDPFPQTARGAFLTNGWWRPLTKLDPIPASPARGLVIFQGTNGSTIPADTELQANGIAYTVQQSVAVVTQSLVLASLQYDAPSGKCIATTASGHTLASGLSVTISGASVAEFNGTAAITVTDDDEFTYAPGSVPGALSATGASVSATWGAAVVEASELGTKTNVSAGGSLTVTTALAGVNATAIAGFGGIQGGADDETAEAYRRRVMKALGTDFGAFTGDEIEILARSVPGVTRVWVRKATRDGANGVYEGQVLVAFVRDGDASPIPSPAEVAEVKSKIVENSMTANTAVEDVMVIAPTPHVVNYSFSSISPNTVSMRAAIRAALQQFHSEGVDFATSIPALDYECAIKGAYDMERRQRLASFSLASPSGDVAVASNELPVLGTITFA